MDLHLLSRTIWLARQTFGLFLLFWPIGLLILAVNLIVVFQHRRHARMLEVNRMSFCKLLLPMLVSLTILFCGSIFRADAEGGRGKNLGVPLIFSLLTIQLILSGWVVSKAHGYKAVAASITAMQFWISVVCAVIAGMSVTGNWL